ncbi:Gfo/Idh/MocA family oxidoreductase [Paenibacillus macerans]|uniref:Gfo/Idh/MocA family protein n=1 Tax=Paenibacillus macerans TaxID=44252 RepID=UPI001B155E5F|nr:Gfo/Idh/MocA family oxidoreductase [Paenibacillus macerans]MBS5913833.1 Gfo/Idh/MocA family oxidoreductase [Paenibacillus macerans]MEC0135425.1 Gfo/Idh/MocA family oxidoreductase [Paenibacillus macerans]GIP12501.1 oxidoreductase [Paenibacillus macerans]
MTLKVGIIGCGGIANGKHMPALSNVEEVEMVAFCDIIVERAEAAKEKFGTKDAQVFDDYKKMLAGADLDVIHVCTPNSSHAELSIAAMEAGCHVMCEKPMAKTSEEARSMIEASKRTGKKLTIGYQNRFRTDSRYLHEICKEGGLGEIYFGKAHAIRRRAVPTWGVFLDEEAQGGGPLIDIGTHALDLTLWMMNNYKPKYVVGKTYHALSQTPNAANAWGPWDPEKFTVEDSAFGFVVMENGATIFLESSWALNSLDVKEAKTTLCGTKAGADMNNGLTINGEDHSLLYEKKIELKTSGVDFYDGAGEKPEILEAKSWVSAILNDTEPVVKPEEALVVTEILEAIYKSSQTGEPVYL